jgi:hypothetical protein
MSMSEFFSSISVVSTDKKLPLISNGLATKGSFLAYLYIAGPKAAVPRTNNRKK